MKMTGRINLQFTYDVTRRGARYTLDGIHWMNNGEFVEAAVKALVGLEPKKDANTSFDAGSDIPEYKASVKSGKASLTTKKLSDTFEGSIKAYFEQTASEQFWFATILDEYVIVWKMNAETFERFIKKFGRLNERGVIRFKAMSSAMMAWLDWNA